MNGSQTEFTEWLGGRIFQCLVLDMEVIYGIYVEQEAMMANLWLMESLRALVRAFPLFFLSICLGISACFCMIEYRQKAKRGFICRIRCYTFIRPCPILCNYATKLNIELRQNDRVVAGESGIYHTLSSLNNWVFCPLPGVLVLCNLLLDYT